MLPEVTELKTTSLGGRTRFLFSLVQLPELVDVPPTRPKSLDHENQREQPQGGGRTKPEFSGVLLRNLCFSKALHVPLIQPG